MSREVKGEAEGGGGDGGGRILSFNGGERCKRGRRGEPLVLIDIDSDCNEWW